MRKFKLVFSILLSFTLLIVTTNIKADEPLPKPIHTITGTLVSKTEEREIYSSTVKIELGFAASVSGVLIQFQLFEGAPPTTWTPYVEPIQIQRRGNYRLRYRSFTLGSKYGEEQAINITVDIPIVEDYPYVMRDNQIIKHNDTGQPIILPLYTEKDEEIRGVWVSTVSNIDIGQHTTDAAYKNEIIKILNRIQSLNMNTVFFQVRSMNDAMYPSDLAPYSRYIKGAQGLGLDWDILRFVIDEAHKRGLELHAWLNPYRVANMESSTSIEQMLATLHEENFAKKNPEYVLKQSNAKAGDSASFILDPGIPEVRDYLNDVIEELLNNYPDVDGIHFDDYFYVTTSDDAQTFTNNNPTNISSLAAWRRNNVDLMIKSVYDLVKDFNSDNDKKVKFGVSPGGIWANKSSAIPEGSNTTGWQSYASLFADTRKWVKEEWLDYIVPQIYWDFAYAPAAFETLVDWWADVARGTNVDLIIGLGFYRYTDNSPWEDPDVIAEQLRYIGQYEEITGHVTFSYRTFNRGLPPVVSTVERLESYYWTKPVDFPWESDVEIIPFDDAEMTVLRDGFRNLIEEINLYISYNEIVSDENLEVEDLILGKKFASKEAFAAINLALLDAENIVDNRFKRQIIIDAKTSLEDAFHGFKEEVYEGFYDPNRQDAVNVLQTAIDQVLLVRNLISDSLGKEASELPEGQYFADGEILAALDSILLEAENIILDEMSISSEINAVYYRLKDQEEILMDNFFQGEMKEDFITITFKNGDDIETINIIKGTTVSKPTDPVKEEQVFVGWYLGEELFDFNTILNEPITLVAVFNEQDIDTVTEILELTLSEFKERLKTIKASNKNPEDLRKNHQYITPELMAELRDLIADAEEMLEDENGSIGNIIRVINDINNAKNNLESEIVIGELESNYKTITIIIGSILAGLAVVGGLTTLVLFKKRK